MKKLLMTILFIFSFNSLGKDKICCIPEKETKPKVIYKTKWKTKVVEKKIPVYKYIPVGKDSNQNTNSHQKTQQKTGNVHKSQTGNQNVVIKMPRERRKKVVVKRRTRTKKVKVKTPNRLQLLVGRSKTNQTVEEANCCDIEASVSPEVDVGLQYIRDFKNVTGSISGTVNGNYYIGIGANW